MLVKPLPGGGALCVGQASHAWLSGQAGARWAWPLGPLREALLLAAAGHDVGMAQWDRAPLRDAETGFPVAFQKMPAPVALDNWTRAPHLLQTQSLGAALLVSHHGRRLFERRTPAPAIDAYLAEQRAVQDAWTRSLELDPADVEAAADLIWCWDALSLAVILDWTPLELPPVSGPDGQPVTIARSGAGLDPWPFTADAVELTCEGRRLEGPSDSEAELHARLAAARPETLTFRLARAVSPPGPR